MNIQEENIKTFQNSTGGLEYQGAFSVELTDNADVSTLPGYAVVKGSTIVTVSHGRIEQVMGGIQFYSREQPFCWDYSYIKVIRDGSGRLLWVNRNQQH